MPERESTSSMLVSACLNLRPPAIAPIAAAAAAAEQAAERAADAAGVVLAEHHRGRDDEVGGDHLALADVLVALQLAACGEGALLHHVAHRRRRARPPGSSSTAAPACGSPPSASRGRSAAGPRRPGVCGSTTASVPLGASQRSSWALAPCALPSGPAPPLASEPPLPSVCAPAGPAAKAQGREGDGEVQGQLHGVPPS